ATAGIWGTDIPLEGSLGNVDSESPRVAVAPNGDALAVWTQFTSSRDSIIYNRYTAQSESWSTIDLVENDDLAWAGSPEVAINAGGDGAAVFLLGNDVWANRYDASGGSWSGEVSLESGSGAATAPKVGIDDAGNVIAVWNQSDGSRSNIWASRYD